MDIWYIHLKVEAVPAEESGRRDVTAWEDAVVSCGWGKEAGYIRNR